MPSVIQQLHVCLSLCLGKACSGESSQAALQTSSSPPLRCCRSLPLSPSRSPLSRLLLCGNHGNQGRRLYAVRLRAAPALLHHPQPGTTGTEPWSCERSLCCSVRVTIHNSATFQSSDSCCAEVEEMGKKYLTVEIFRYKKIKKSSQLLVSKYGPT